MASITIREAVDSDVSLIASLIRKLADAPAIGFSLGLGARPAAGWNVYRLEGEALGRLAAAD